MSGQLLVTKGDVEYAGEGIRANLAVLKFANRQTEMEGRELTTAVINIEQGLLWLEKALVCIEKHQPPADPT